jgi:glycine cleavage system aminomethyltransferase T
LGRLVSIRKLSLTSKRRRFLLWKKQPIRAAAADAMAKLCEVDLRGRKFPPGSIAQTSIARVNGVVISHNFGPRPGFFILCDTASTEYLWRSIIDAIDEYNGGAVGLQNITTAGPN